MSKLPSLTEQEAAWVQDLVRGGLQQYGINAEDAVQHAGCVAVRGPYRGLGFQKVVGDYWPELRCPCGTRKRMGLGLPGQLIRNALRPNRRLTYHLALDVLRLIDRCDRVSEWRAHWRRENSGRDPWSLLYGRTAPRLAIKAGLIAKANELHDLRRAEKRGDLDAALLVEMQSAPPGRYGTAARPTLAEMLQAEHESRDSA